MRCFQSWSDFLHTVLKYYKNRLTGKPAFPGKSYNDVLAKNRKCEILFDAALFENVP